MKPIRTAAGIVAGLVLLAGCAVRTQPVATTPSVSVPQDAQLNRPTDSLWRRVPVHPAPLTLQDVVEPRLPKSSTPEVRVQASTNGSRVFFRLEWDDPTKDDLPGVGRFADAVAIQVPARTEPSAPAPEMGEPDHPVEISYWSAFWQATVDGRPHEIQAIYPRARVDHYPFQTPGMAAGSPQQAEMEMLYSPARAVGNTMAGPRTQSVQDLLAEGPGTLRPAPQAISRGQGFRTNRGWAVVFSRPLPEGWSPGQPMNLAFAVWQGSAGEVGSRKMRSEWIPIPIEQSR